MREIFYVLKFDLVRSKSWDYWVLRDFRRTRGRRVFSWPKSQMTRKRP